MRNENWVNDTGSLPLPPLPIFLRCPKVVKIGKTIAVFDYMMDKNCPFCSRRFKDHERR